MALPLQAQEVPPPPTTQPVSPQGQPPAGAADQRPAALRAAMNAAASGSSPTTSTNGVTVNGATTRPATQAILQPGGGILLNFNDASINSILDELSAVAGFIIIKTVQPDGRVSLVSRQPVKAEEIVSLLNTVLSEKGYAAIQQGRTLKIVTRDVAKTSGIPVRTIKSPSDLEPTDELITAVIPAGGADAVQLRNELAQMVSPNATWTANASSNSLMITDTAANVRRIVEVVRALDTSVAASADVRVFQLQFASAANAARLINDVFRVDAQQQGRGGSIPGFGGRGGGDRGGRGGGDNPFAAFLSRGGQATSARAPVRVNASSDDRTNTVVVVGPPDTLDTIERVIRELDSDPAAENQVFSYRVKNGRALQLEYVVNNMFGANTGGGGNRARTTTGGAAGSNQLRTQRSTRGATGGGALGGGGGFGGTGGGRGGTGGFGGTSGRGGTGGFGGNNSTFGGRGGTTGGFTGRTSSGAQRTAGALAGEVYAVADEDTNSLLIMTNPKNWEGPNGVLSVLEELDRPTPQVLIKVLIAEVSHDNGVDLGAEFSILNLGGTQSGTATTDASPNGSLGTSFGVAQSTGGLKISLMETEITAALRAIQTVGKLDVLSRPYILASDNQLASITVGQEVPFITNTRITEQGGTINTIQYQDIGIILDVIPHINPDGLVILDVAPEISTLTGTTVPISETVDAPVFAKRSAQTRVAIKNGQTIVIGGLMEDRRTETQSKVPLMGDIPIVGLLFRRTQKTTTKTELLIFLTPHVATEPDTLRPISQEEMDGTKLVPRAVQPGLFPEHLEGMQRGSTAPTTQQLQSPQTDPNASPANQNPLEKAPR